MFPTDSPTKNSTPASHLRSIYSTAILLSYIRLHIPLSSHMFQREKRPERAVTTTTPRHMITRRSPSCMSLVVSTFDKFKYLQTMEGVHTNTSSQILHCTKLRLPLLHATDIVRAGTEDESELKLVQISQQSKDIATQKGVLSTSTISPSTSRLFLMECRPRQATRHNGPPSQYEFSHRLEEEATYCAETEGIPHVGQTTRTETHFSLSHMMRYVLLLYDLRPSKLVGIY